MDIYLIRGFAAAYLLFAAAIALVLWLNAGAEDATKNAVIALASVLPTAAALATYLVPKVLDERLHVVLLYDSEAKAFTSGDVGGAYWSAFANALPGVPYKANTFDEAFGKSGLDLLERAVINELTLKFSMTWDMEFTKYRGPGGMEGAIGSGPADHGGETLTVNSLRTTFSDNLLAGTIGPWNLVLPPGTTIRRRGTMPRQIEFANPYVRLLITLTPTSGSVLQHGIEGALYVPRGTISNRYYALSYFVDLQLRPTTWRTYSPEMPSYRRWYDNVVQTLTKLEWDSIQQRIDQKMMRDHMAQAN